ncbi:MAG: hypothetical protein H6606_09430 [Flavobacteriales bacterium]|nr:hypothetical protein [Flavobacteriales bacterium]
MSLRIENLNYFRNVEYRSPIDEGRTLFGLQFSPEVSYQIDDAWKVSSGLFLKRDFGSDEFDQNFPTFQLKYAHENLSFIFGRLEGNMDHGLIEPLLDPERTITDRVENGFQFLMSRDRFDLDIWLDWRKAIYPLSAFREEFDAGVTGQYNIVRSDSFILSIPVDILAHHKGGEIDTSGLPSVSQFTFSYGSSFSWQLSGNGVRRIRGGVYFNNYEDVSTRATTFIDGLGQYAFLSADWREFGLMITYWDSHQFQSSNGDVYYQSVSRKDPAQYLLDYRKVWMFRAFFERDFGNDLALLARVNYIYDVNERQNDLITEFYLRWNGVFNLHKFKK